MSNNQLKNHENQHPNTKTFLPRGIKTVNRLHEHLKAF